ncbi:MAG: polysaccharide deacetylase family protein [Bacilli bacterium]|nr:polysaccharide deacetylase family protein [Bacilli bacterium]
MTKMDQFKLKKIKATKTEKTLVLTILILIGFVYLFYPLNTVDKPILYKSENTENPAKKLEFEGELQSEILLGEQYLNVVYLNNGDVESHLVDIKNGEEISIQDFIVDEQEINFIKKEKELLLKKYPSSIVEILLESAKKEYFFKEEYLEILYDTENLVQTERSFSLKVYYVEIQDYLVFDTPSLVEHEPEDGYVTDPNKLSVSFTFDDGPNGTKTQELVDALEDYKMSATFFMVGYKLSGDAQTVKKVYDSHSEVGYHSYKHAYFTSQSSATIKEEFAISDKILNDITGGHFKLTRPPYGAYNKNTLDSIDNSFIRWNLDTNDWRYKDVEYIKSYVLDNLSDGSIILFHDTYNTSIEAAISLLEILYLMDVQVLSISELAKVKGVSLEDHQVYYDFK